MLNIFTIVLNGMPFIKHHYDELVKYEGKWQWVIVEGAAKNSRDTAWCARQAPQLSDDGTNEYVRELTGKDRRVLHVSSPLWDGKVMMVNTACVMFDQPGVLLQMDVDEFWTAQQLLDLRKLFRRPAPPEFSVAQFKCRYFVGPDIITDSEYGYGNKPGEWVRAWRWKSGMRFTAHEPPFLAGARREKLGRTATAQLGLVFDHCAWVLPEQVAYKERFYKYPLALDKWTRLQANTIWPVKLNRFFTWADPYATARRVGDGEGTAHKYLT
jgi:hypothetical protein